MPSLVSLIVSLTHLALGASPALASSLPSSLPAISIGSSTGTSVGTAPIPAPIPDETPVHLGVSLLLGDEAGLDALLARQQDPSSADYHRWLTPEEFGERFGQPAEVYERAAGWLEGAGMMVTRFPNRIFLEAQGSAAQANALLSLRLWTVDARGPAVHVPDQPPTLPASLSDLVLHVSGLDTRGHFKHRLAALAEGALLRTSRDLRPLLQPPTAARGRLLRPGAKAGGARRSGERGQRAEPRGHRVLPAEHLGCRRSLRTGRAAQPAE